MLWSRYNTLFHSERFGYFLYNALTNTLIELDEAHYTSLKGFRAHQSFSGAEDGSGFFSLLFENKILIETGEETRLLLAREYKRNAICFDTSHLGLTICPTLQCNFLCPYCFEHDQKGSSMMTSETAERLLYFIKSYKEVRHLSITWYGGEPLLAFDIIGRITKNIKALDIDFEGAGMVTNGYLLNSEKIAQLDELKVNFIQITLDGPEKVHDTRRVLAKGGPTFQTILSNVDALMNSTYKGFCAIRINVDKRNYNQFVELRASLLERFKGKNLSVHAGRVDTSINHTYNHACSLDLHEWTKFIFDVHHKSGQPPVGGFYPPDNLVGICVATTHQAFVVGPEGELYKCWEDVGKPEMIIGTIHQDESVANPELRALYSIGTDAYRDQECRKCAVLPICGGGCANKRLRTKQFGEKGPEFCSPYKEDLTNYLEAYIDAFKGREICDAVLSPGLKKQDERGYRLISPEKKKDENSRNPA